MTLTEGFISELTREASSTRRVLERVPEEKLGWKPHRKSMTLGELAMHIALLPQGIAGLLDELQRELPEVPRPEATSREQLLVQLDRSVAFATDKLWQWGEHGLAQTWKLTCGGKTLIELPRMQVFRSVMLNHWYHHRGQLSVYLRMLDVPLPALYGPSADESPFG